MARDFATAGDVVDCGTSSIFDNLAPFTYYAWIRPDDITLSNEYIFMCKGDTSSPVAVTQFLTGDYSVAGSDRLVCYIAHVTTSAVSQSAEGSMTANEWQFVAATWAGGTATIKLYRGTPTAAMIEVTYAEQTAPVGARQSDAGRKFTIGNRSDGAGGYNALFDGKVAFAGIHNVVLNLDELQQVQRALPVTRGRLGFWPLWGAQSPEPDWSGNNNHGTLTGAVRFDHPPGIALWGVAARGVVAEVAASINYSRVLSDSINVQDVPVRGQLRGRVASESLAVFDLLLRSQRYGRALADSLNLNDVASRHAQLFRLAHEDVTLLDAFVRGAIFNRNLVEAALAVLDDVFRGQTYGRVILDSTSVDDLAIRFVRLFRSLRDDVVVEDLLSSLVTTTVAIIRTLADNVSLNDGLLRYISAYRRASDVVDLTDSVFRGQRHERVTQDTAEVVDSLLRAGQLHRLEVDQINISEVLISSKVHVHIVSEVLSLADALFRATSVGRTLIDSVEISEAVSRYALMYRLLTDDVTTRDDLIKTLTLFERVVGHILLLLSEPLVEMSFQREPITLVMEDSQLITVEFTADDR